VDNEKRSDSGDDNPIGIYSLLCQLRRKMSPRWIHMIVWLGLIVLVGCRTPPPAPVDQRPQPPSEKINDHLVSSGETLFSIAWRFEKDVNKLARANGISRPYTIYNYQRLTLDTNRLPPVVQRPAVTTSKPALASRPEPKSTTRPITKAQTKVTSPPPPKAPVLPSNWRWQWPTTGRVSKRFNSSSLFKGIDIQGNTGAPVVTAAPGVVVYSGSDLRGYGQLIIVKHSEVFLSAYAHNRKIFVKEGQVLKGGQKISEVGGDPSNSKRLYFEIRKNGKPVDPMRHLPTS
jgi:lipoprotein NlpD